MADKSVLSEVWARRTSFPFRYHHQRRLEEEADYPQSPLCVDTQAALNILSALVECAKALKALREAVHYADAPEEMERAAAALANLPTSLEGAR